MSQFHKFIYHKIIRPLRLRTEVKIINKLKGKELLEIGYFDDFLKKSLDKDKEYFGIDPYPNKPIKGMPKISIEKYFSDKKFDIVVASNVLEHIDYPGKALDKIKSLSKKYIFISVPSEPFYTITRFFQPEYEHLWTIHPTVLRKFLGKPVFEKFIHFRRTYIAIYKFPFKDEN